MTSTNWDRFYGFTKDSPPWPLLIRAAALAPEKGAALDLGAGAGRDTRYLLGQGFSVTSVDAEPASAALLRAIESDRLRVVRSSFQDFDFTGAPFDLISAQFALPFIPRAHFAQVFARITSALAPGGVFAGQFFGDRDEWATSERDMTFVTRQEAESLLRALETIELTEEDEDGHKADGSPKHWHIFHILARKR